jgi:hypothetical protein
VQTITPAKAAEMLESNTTNRPLSRPVVRAFAEAMERGDWMVTHQGIAFDVNGVLVDGQHRLAAVIEAEIPVDMTVFTEVDEGTFDVLDTMVRTVWLYENRPDLSWSGGGAAVTNHQVVQTLDLHPRLRNFVTVGEQIAVATGMIKSAAGAASYLASRASRKAELDEWFEGIVDGAGLVKGDPRLVFRRVMFGMARKHVGQAIRRREGREHLALYITAFNAWRAGERITSLRFSARDPLPRISPSR